MTPKSKAESASPDIFATTHWSLIAGAQERGTAESEAALEKLCGIYWRPVYAFVRRSSPDEHVAKDLTQGFFAKFLEKEYFREADQLRGRFRSFMLACVKHFMANQFERQRAQRRGGGTTLLSLDQLIEETGAEPESDRSLTPDRCYDRQWAQALLDNAKFKLQLEFEESGKSDVYSALKVYLSGDRDEAPYLVVAESLGLSVAAVKKQVERMRRRYGELLREAIAETVLHASEIDDELKALRAALQN